MRSAILLALAACAMPDEHAAAPGDVWLYRVQDGDSLSVVADQLSYPGGMRALAAANRKKTTELRAGEGLRVPIQYLLDAGIEPVAMGLEPIDAALPHDPLVACRAIHARGSCVDTGIGVACIEATPPRREPTPDEDVSDRWCFDEQVDGANDCQSREGRELVLYRNDVRSVIAALPSMGGEELEVLRVDLDGDRSDELVIGNTIERWRDHGASIARVHVIGRAGTTQLDIAEFGPGAIAVADDGTCDLVATTWEDDVQPLDPPGTYLVARRMIYRRGELVPRGDRIVRRLRDYFYMEETLESPAAFFRGARASRWADRAPAADLRRGSIVAIDRVDGWIAITVAHADGAVVRYDPSLVEDDRTAAVDRLGYLRWAETGGQLPDLYIPPDPARWIGRDVLVDRATFECETCGGEPWSRTIWL